MIVAGQSGREGIGKWGTLAPSPGRDAHRHDATCPERAWCGACWQRDSAAMAAEGRRLDALKAAYGLAGFTPADIWAADRFGGHTALARLKRDYPWPPAPGTLLARYGAARPRYGQA